MKCIKCNNEHDGSFGSGKYCSRACANSRVRTEETKKKISEGVKTSVKFVEGSKQRFVDYKELGKKLKQIADTKILEADYDTLTYDRLKKRIVLEQNQKCNHCGIDKWNNKPIVLELEHIDGNHYNNERENLEVICPNCHSQTDTWRGRNKTNKRLKISDDEIVKAYIKTNSIRQTLLEVGLAAKGGNYKRVHGIVKKYEL
jgi:Zn finger protein HypA/HybF involved in hydrogenase expression